jgi:toxin ParE1/3/4
MRREIVVLPRADADFEHYFVYLSHESLDVALRFLDAVRVTVNAIAEWPEAGRCREWPAPIRLRIWSRPVNGFPNHIVFYLLPEREAVQVIRVLHGAMDLDAVFGGE